MNAIILCSGPGSRMKPFTDNKNKCMFKVAGIPLLKIHIQKLKEIGITSIYVTTHWKSEQINRLSIIPNDDLGGGNMRVSNGVFIYKEDGLYGSGTAVSGIIKRYGLERTIVINGDTWYSDDFYTKLAHLYNTDKNYILCEKKMFETGMIIYDTDNFRVAEILENKKIDFLDEGYDVCKNIGTLIINHDIIGEGDLMCDMLPLHKNKLHIHLLEVDWCDIGEIDRFIELTLKLYDNKTVNRLICINKELTISFVKYLLFAERIFICGNGGSMNTAQHLALDFSKCGKKNAIALDGPGFITAYANDLRFEEIFTAQLEKFNVTDKDVVLLLSGSGNSQNIKRVIIEYRHRTTILGMSGEKGYLCDNIPVTLPVRSDNIRVIEDAHLAYGHAATEVMDYLIN